MKKVLVAGAILASVLAGNLSAAEKEVEWYFMDMNTYACLIPEKGLNPYTAKQAGLDVTDNGGGRFTLSIDGKSMMWFDSKKGCEKASKILKSKK